MSFICIYSMSVTAMWKKGELDDFNTFSTGV